MRLILVSDIFGRTPSLERIQSELSLLIGKTSIVDPYGGKQIVFKNQDQAYQYFMKHIGLEKYQAILEAELNSSNSPIVLIGFSVGASAIWGLSPYSCYKHVRKAFGFYGSQIRHNPDISPLFDIKLIFPETEPHFNVDILIGQLESRPHVICRKASGPHGFMNRLSDGFDQKCYDLHMDELKYSLQLLSSKKY